MSSPQLELKDFLADLNDRRVRLLELAAPGSSNAALLEELTILGEQVIVADEELRAQREELDETRRGLQSLAAERDLLRQSATDANVLTEYAMQLTAELASTAEELAGGRSVDDVLASVLHAAARIVTGAEQAAISLIRPRQHLEVVAWEGAAALAGEQAQLELHEGPVVEVAALGARVGVDDVLDDSRWPILGERMRGLGIRSILALPLKVARDRLGTLTLYANQPAAFDETAEFAAAMLSAHAAVAVSRALAEENLRLAIKSRQDIGQAVGILVERQRLTAEAAFEHLVQASQRKHMKVRNLARIVVETGQDPADIGTT